MRRRLGIISVRLGIISHSLSSSELGYMLLRMPKSPKSSKARQGADRAGGPAVAGVVRADEVYRLAELKRRLGWQDHALRQARRAGLRLIPFGREKFALGSDVLDFFRRLADKQDGGPEGSNGRGQS